MMISLLLITTGKCLREVSVRLWLHSNFDGRCFNPVVVICLFFGHNSVPKEKALL